MLYWAGNDVSSGVHGFYMDDIRGPCAGEMGRGSDNLRVLYWNIQNGMWSDQANNYNNFVAWVKKYDPDVCVWCESATIYKDNTNSAQASSARFLPDGWAAPGGPLRPRLHGRRRLARQLSADHHVEISDRDAAENNRFGPGGQARAPTAPPFSGLP